MPDCYERKRHAATAKRLASASASVASVAIVVLAIVWIMSRWVNDDVDRFYPRTAFAAGMLTAILGVAFWALEVASAVYDQEAQREDNRKTRETADDNVASAVYDQEAQREDNRKTRETADDNVASGVSIAAAVFVTFAAAAVVGSGMTTALPLDGAKLSTHHSRIEYYGFALFMLAAFALPLTVAAAATIQPKNC